MLGLMGDDRKGLASILVSKMDDMKMECPIEEEYNGEMALEDASMRIIKAVKEEDAEMLASSLKEAVEYCMMKYGAGDKGMKVEMEF